MFNYCGEKGFPPPPTDQMDSSYDYYYSTVCSVRRMVENCVYCIAIILCTFISAMNYYYSIVRAW